MMYFCLVIPNFQKEIQTKICDGNNINSNKGNGIVNAYAHHLGVSADLILVTFLEGATLNVNYKVYFVSLQKAKTFYRSNKQYQYFCCFFFI